MKTLWHFGALAALAGFCMAPSDCDPSTSTSDAGAVDAAADAATGTGTGTGTGTAQTPRQVQATKDCKNRGACSVTNGAAFSQTECETNNAIEGERADSRQCIDAYDAYLQCVAAITYDCTQPIDTQIQAACNNPLQTYATCMAN